MLDKNYITELSQLRNLKPYQQEKHYIQTVILVALSDYPLIFKGGTYLWFFHNLDRYSTDLDFTIQDLDNIINPEEFAKEMMTKVKTKLKLIDGIDCKCKLNTFRKGVGFSIKVSVEGPLYTSPRSLCYVDIDVSFREKVILPTVSYSLDMPAYNFPVVIITGMNLQEVLSEKIRAILTRDSVRDVYDLWYLLDRKEIKLTKEVLDHVNQKLKYVNLSFDINEFKKKLKEKEANFNNLNQIVFRKLEKFDYYYNSIIEHINKKKKK